MGWPPPSLIGPAKKGKSFSVEPIQKVYETGVASGRVSNSMRLSPIFDGNLDTRVGIVPNSVTTPVTLTVTPIETAVPATSVLLILDKSCAALGGRITVEICSASGTWTRLGQVQEHVSQFELPQTQPVTGYRLIWDGAENPTATSVSPLFIREFYLLK